MMLEQRFTRVCLHSGIKAGDYLDAKSNQKLTLLEDKQKLVLEESGTPLVLYYRVKSATDDEVHTFMTSTAPSDDKGSLWVDMSFTLVGGKLITKFGDTTASYDACELEQSRRGVLRHGYGFWISGRF